MQKNDEKIFEVISEIENYILQNEYKGYDPYDALKSPFFKLPVLKTNKIIRLGMQQVVKRLPINFRGVLGIKKGLNPVTLGLCVQAFTYLSKIFPDKKDFYFKEIDFLINELEKVSSKGYSGMCWGYNFDWEARYAKIPAYTPTVVATGIITNGLYENFKLTGNERAMGICKSATEFVLKDLNRSYEGDTFCFSYSPIDKQRVYNATMKGARLLVQAGYAEEATKTVKYVIENQEEDGSWSYSNGDSRKWKDNFHTGYVLECLEAYWSLGGEMDIEENIKRGKEYYMKNFFEREIPKYYDKSLYPIDSTAIGQAIITLCKFDEVELARKVILWSLENMYNGEGYFYYQKHKYYTNKIPYMRWSNVWMFAGLSYYSYKKERF